MDLAKEIKDYYYKNSSLLPKSKQFHLASRLAAWCGSEEYFKMLENLTDYMLPGDARTTLKRIMAAPPKKLYANKLRLSIFGKYPGLYAAHEAMFRVRHLLEVYGNDTREVLLELVGQKELEELYAGLKKDYEALRALGRFAVDFIYLYESFYGSNDPFNPEVILDQKDKYNLKNAHEIHLLIYLYTHTVIADSNFYIRTINPKYEQIYKQMVSELDGLVDKYFENIKMDTKFEYLVASRIIGKKSPLSERLFAEAQDSLSSEGAFVVDKFNEPAHSSLNTFSGSEHRNVLFIMSGSLFTPHKTLIEGAKVSQ